VGIIAGPGVFYGDFYPEHIRISLTATDEDIAQAATRLTSG
jgi:aspartate/methionine/tyrosine aminotransferase